MRSAPDSACVFRALLDPLCAWFTESVDARLHRGEGTELAFVAAGSGATMDAPAARLLAMPIPPVLALALDDQGHSEVVYHGGAAAVPHRTQAAIPNIPAPWGDANMIRRIVLVLLSTACAGIAHAEMPEELLETLAKSEAPANARAEVEAGKAPVWVFERDTGAEQISVAGIVKLSGSPRRIADDFFSRDSMLEADTLKASGTFSEPAILGDVAGYRVPESDIEVLADCEVHACKFKLGERMLKQLEAIDWEAPDARNELDALVRRRMVDFVAAYQKEGRAALGRYVDKPDSRSVSEATDILLEQMQDRALLEAVRTHFRGYPKSRVAGTRDRLHWNVRDYGYRPVTSVVHTVAFDPQGGEPAMLIAAETLYSSHYFYARLQLFGFYTDTADPNRTYALYGDRLLFDDQVGMIQRRMLRKSVVDDLRERLGEVRRKYPAP